MKKINIQELLLKHGLINMPEFEKKSVVEFAKDLANQALDLAAEEATVTHPRHDEEDYEVNKQAILNIKSRII